MNELNDLLALLRSGRPAEVERRAHALLDASAETPPEWRGAAWQLLGAALQAQGRDALPALAAAVRCLPGDPVALLNLGNALGRAGRLADARAHFEQALRLKPDFAEAHYNLADVELESGAAAAAAEHCRRAIALQPAFAAAHHGLARAASALGSFEAAVASCRRALHLEANAPEVENTLGFALARLGRVDEALAAFGRALARRPGFLEAELNRAALLRSVGRLDAAEAGFRRALALDPTRVRVHVELATVLRLQRRSAEAEASARAALALEPESAAALGVLAELCADLGHFADAERLLGQAAELDPQSPDAWAALTRMRRMTPADAGWLAGAGRLLARGLAPPGERVLRYAMGKYCDDVGAYEDAFAHYRRANQLARAAAPPHDRAALEQQTAALMLRAATGAGAAGVPPGRPVFIVGMLRSGTTLVEQILASHPQVQGAGELPFWTERLREPAPSCADLARWRADYLAELDALADRTGEGGAGAGGAARVIDKMPTNFWALGLIQAALPEASIIHVERHPLDTCLSIYFQNFEAANTYATDLADIGHYYAQYLRLMAHWRRHLAPMRLLEVSYEGLVQDLPGTARRMLEFLGLPWDDRCIDFHRMPRTVVTASKWQVRQPLDPSAVGRWRHYARHLEFLTSLVSDALR